MTPARKEAEMDKYKLEYVRKRKGFSVEDLCTAIGMSKTAYYRKCNGTSEFTQSEIVSICETLELDSPMGIFFAAQVS